MRESGLARPRSVHYAIVIAVLTFVSLLAAAGLRAAPGVLLLPLQLGFGWDRATVSAGAGLGILVNGLVGPFAASLMQTYGIKRVLLAGLGLMAAATSASLFMTQAWQYLLTWGLISGVGSGAVAGVLAAAVVNRWFAKRQGLVMGLLSASTATGSLIFLPAMAGLAASGDWRPVVRLVAAAMLILLPIVWLLFRERPADLGRGRLGAQAGEVPPVAPAAHPLAALGELRRASREGIFWLLFTGFFVCGFTTNGLVGTHLIAFCGDQGIPPVEAAGWLAFMGVFDIVGATASGWLSDRYDPRKLLVIYFGLRGMALAFLPVLPLDGTDLVFFSLLFGLDWIATVPPTLKIVNATFGQVRGPVVYGWVFTAHQAGAGAAALGAGFVRDLTGGYGPAFVTGGAMAIAVALVFAVVSRRQPPTALTAT